MSVSRVVQVREALSGAGYSPVPPPLEIGRIRFDGVELMTASEGSIDLVLILDSLKDPAVLVERLTRALDAVGSRRPLTAIVIADADAGAEAVEVRSMMRFCRVLTVGDGISVPAALAPLLPLEFEDESGDMHGLTLSDLEAQPVAEGLTHLFPNDGDDESAVRMRLADWLAAPLKQGTAS